MRVRSSLLLVVLVLLAFSGCRFVLRQTNSGKIPLKPPNGKVYHGVFPGGTTGAESDIKPADLSSYENAVGKKAAWVMFSDNWYQGRAFPTKTVKWIHSNGSVPYIRLMLRSGANENAQEKNYTLKRIIDGKFDLDLRAWARGARTFGSPLLVEYGTEVNGGWFPWNAMWNDESKGPERFRQAYQHIIDLMREERAANIIWVFHVNEQDVPEEDWNRFERYYPGDDYIDWIGVSVYGAQRPTDREYPLFREHMDQAYPRLKQLSYTKPIIVSEFGVTNGFPDEDQAVWADNALKDLTGGRWSRVIGFSWWNEGWDNDGDPDHRTDMRVQDNPALAQVFKTRIGAQKRVLGKVSLVGNTVK